MGADYRASEHNPHIWIVSGPTILLGLDVLAVFMRPLLIAYGPWHAWVLIAMIYAVLVSLWADPDHR